MDQKVKSTPMPWRVIAGDDYYITADGYPSEFIGHFKGDDMGPYLALVGNRPKDFGEANAALIVRAVNRDHHFDALVKALEAVADAKMPGEARRIARTALDAVGRRENAYAK